MPHSGMEPPGRVELFAFYYLGFSPDGAYKFPNVRHVAAYYRATAEDVQDWLELHGITPQQVQRTGFNLAEAQVDLLMDSPNLTPQGILLRAAAVLKEMGIR